MDNRSLKICRLCLEKLGDISTSYALTDENRSKVLESVTSLKLNTEEGFPTKSCLKCWLNVMLAYKIQQKILQANEMLITKINELKATQEQDDSAVQEEHEIEELEPMDQTAEETGDEADGDEEDIVEETEGDSELATEVLKMEIKQELPTELHIIKEEDIPNNENSELKLENLSEHEVITIYDETNRSLRIKSEESSSYCTCRICNKRIQEDKYFEHVKQHYTTRVQCDECYTFCENIKSYQEHVVTRHKDLPSFFHCELCDSVFRYKPLWKIHMETAHAKKIKKDADYECTFCKKKFQSEKKFLAHLKTHYKKECHICGMKITPTNFKKHVDSHGALPVVCHICGITYKNTTSLRSHIHYTHSTRTYMCKICKKVYKKSYDLIMHEKKEHTGKKDYVCDVCGKAFFTQYNLNKHKRMTHMKLRPFVCQYCKKKFSSKHALVTHERQHTNVTPYTCEVCGEGFRQNVSLKGHKKSKHNIVEPDTCECKVCGKKFSGPFAIISHMRLH